VNKLPKRVIVLSTIAARSIFTRQSGNRIL